MKISIGIGLACSVITLNATSTALAESSKFDRAFDIMMAARAKLSPATGHLSATYETARTIATRPSSAAWMEKMQDDLPVGFELGDGSTVALPSLAPDDRLGAAGHLGATTRYIGLYPVTYRGISLARGSDVMTISDADGEIMHKRQRGIPRKVDATEPEVFPGDAVALGLEALAAHFSERDTIEASIPELEIWVSADQRGRLAWSYYLHNGSPTVPVSLKVWVAAALDGKAEILNVENAVFHGGPQTSGLVTGDLWQGTPLEETTNIPLPDVYVSRRAAEPGSPFIDWTTTDEDGAFSFPDELDDVTVDATLAGPFSTVVDASMDDEETDDVIEGSEVLTIEVPGVPGDPVALNFAPQTDDEIAQVTAFHYTNIAHRMVADFIDPPNDTVDLRELRTIVNITDVCNAFYFNQGAFKGINFFQAGEVESEDEEGNPVTLSCTNSANPDIVIHEFGHAFDDAKGGILDAPYSEGFSDVLALFETRDPCLGRHFISDLECVRKTTDVLLWPPSEVELEGAPHPIGQRYSGFVWEFIQQLQTELSEDEAYDIAQQLVLGVAQANPADILDAVHLSFVVDDDDGDLTNGTPRSEALEAAAASRNLPTTMEMSTLSYRFMRKAR